MWARAFTAWYGLDVVRLEPSAAMRARDPTGPVVDRLGPLVVRG